MFTHGFMKRRAAWMRRLAMSLTFALGLLPVISLAPAANAQGTLPPTAPVRTILLFPASLGSAATNAPADLTTRLDDAIKLRLALVGNYSVTSYTRFLPSVQRALSESADGGLTDADVQPPFTNPGNAQRIAALVGTDSFMLATISSYSQDATTRHVSITVNAHVFYSQSGNLVQGLGIGVNGEAGPASASDSDLDIQQGAINDAAAKIASTLNNAAGPPKVVVATSSQRGSGRGAEYVLGAVLIGALVYAILSGSHFGGGSNNSSSGLAGSSGGSGGTTSSGGGSGPPAPPTVSVRH